MTNIICYTGGTCGDLLTAFFDTSKAKVDPNGSVLHDKHRTLLKKPHATCELEKIKFLQQCQYLSVPSHSLQFHVDHAHDFYSVSVDSKADALWAAARFRDLHKPHVWLEMCQACGVDSIDGYAQTLLDYSNMVAHYTNKIVKLEYILDGSALDKISNICDCELDPEAAKFYSDWLNINEKLCNTGQRRSQYQN